MRTVEPRTRVEGYGASGTYTCPHCHGGLCRIPRRMTDRFQSLFAPARRFRCNTLACNWEGNLRVSKDDARSTELPVSVARSSPLRRRASTRSSRWLVVNVVFVVAGTAAVVVAGTTDWLTVPQSARKELSEEQWLATAKAGGGAKLGNTKAVTSGASKQTNVAGRP